MKQPTNCFVAAVVCAGFWITTAPEINITTADRGQAPRHQMSQRASRRERSSFRRFGLTGRNAGRAGRHEIIRAQVLWSD